MKLEGSARAGCVTAPESASHLAELNRQLEMSVPLSSNAEWVPWVRTWITWLVQQP